MEKTLAEATHEEYIHATYLEEALRQKGAVPHDYQPVLEFWSIGVLGFKCITPSLHYSNTPDSTTLSLVKLLDKAALVQFCHEARIGKLLRLVTPDIVARHCDVLEAYLHPRMIGIGRWNKHL